MFFDTASKPNHHRTCLHHIWKVLFQLALQTTTDFNSITVAGFFTDSRRPPTSLSRYFVLAWPCLLEYHHRNPHEESIQSMDDQLLGRFSM